MEQKERPLVSIGVPVYNGDKYLEECLDSVLNQTYRNWECNIIDNKSTDKTGEIARKYAEMDSRFKLYTNEEFVDQTENWNISYARTSGDAKYFKVLCADDWIFPLFLEKMVDLLELNIKAGFSSSFRIDGTRVRCDGLDIYHGNFFKGRDILLRQLKSELDITGSVSTLLFRIDVLKRLTYHPQIFQPDVYHIDTVLAYDLLYESDLAYTFDVLSYTRRHNETYTSKISNRFHTSYYLRELEVSKFMHMDPSLKKLYRKIRIDYAYFLLSRKLGFDRECLEWHRRYLARKITLREYFVAMLSRNVISRQLKKFSKS